MKKPVLSKHLDMTPERPDKRVPPGLDRNCAMSDTVNLLSQPWAFLILREAFYGARRYSDFAKLLGVSRATLSSTLTMLVEEGLFSLENQKADSTWKLYRLTPKSRDLFSVFLGFNWFGDKWLTEELPPVAMFHRTCGSWFSPRLVWQETGELISPHGIRVQLLDNYWREKIVDEPRRRRVNRPGVQMGVRPCSMERLLSVVGDRWTFLLLRELFHGNHTFHEFSENLGISSNALAERLKFLTEAGFIRKEAEQVRGGYHLSEKGIDIYGPMILMKFWGDKWLDRPDGISMRFIDRHSEQNRTAMMVCSSCREYPEPREVLYRAGY